MFTLKKIGWLLVALTLVALILAACTGGDVLEVTRVQEVTRMVTETRVVGGGVTEVPRVVTTTVVITVTPAAGPEPAGEPVTFDGTSTTDLPTLDPQVAEDAVSITYIENLFVHLTNYDLVTAEVVPEAATSWEVSEDGLVYTFHLRTDIPWVYHNPVTDETTQEIEFDADGNEVGPRFVTANDFVYGIKRACDPNTGGYYSSVIAPLIAGCSAVLNAEDPEAIDPALVEAIGVAAP
ncbi:MAG: ABC transporter substrate-binding protein, partial [Chloroflexi bacterium]|nr:ABC transporter substrate-binding protein [Chloroflexota bacterium]MCI0646599.1 ABC transporter substrate-binding protein [Chloroflexota bacterium]MCI0729607.1 ABC transporter substrate-binding protein [Chloroflexota bacterium]